MSETLLQFYLLIQKVSRFCKKLLLRDKTIIPLPKVHDQELT